MYAAGVDKIVRNRKLFASPAGDMVIFKDVEEGTGTEQRRYKSRVRPHEGHICR